QNLVTEMSLGNDSFNRSLLHFVEADDSTSSSLYNASFCPDCETSAPNHFLDQMYLLTFGIMIV
ncbi:hypothetical protein BgiBS90_017913, partial [Biomphalaria glabrata]